MKRILNMAAGAVNILLIFIFLSPGDEDMTLSLIAGGCLLIEAVVYGACRAWQHRPHRRTFYPGRAITLSRRGG